VDLFSLLELGTLLQVRRVFVPGTLLLCYSVAICLSSYAQQETSSTLSENGYVDGLMDGQALELVEEDNAMEREFEIV
jgi:hypothetical protein